MQPSAASAQSWLAIGESVGPEYAAASRFERRAILERAAEKYGRQPHTIRRIVNAAEYVSERIGSSGLPRDQLAAPVVSVEALARIEALNPSLASSLLVPVLRGEIPFRSLLSRENDLRGKAGRAETNGRSRAARMREEWEAFASATHHLLGPGNKEWTFGPDRSLYPARAQLSRVDWLVTGECIEPTAVFITPAVVLSTFSRSADLQPMHVLGATYLFPRVVYLCLDEDEEVWLRSLVESACVVRRPDLEFQVFGDLDYVRRNASTLLTPIKSTRRPDASPIELP